MTTARNDFAPRLGRAIELDPDYYREAKEHFANLESRSAEETAAEQAQLAAPIVALVGCGECAAVPGEPCRGLGAGTHFARGLAYATRGGA